MRGDRWGIEGPPDEAYSRVTEPERFASLHDFALQLLDRLIATYDVERVEGQGFDAERETIQRSGPSIRLIPRDQDAAPIAVSFTTFPGLGVRFGRWHEDSFPSCGCDACDETAEREIERLEQAVEDVVAGRFRESIRLPVVGAAWQSHELWSGKSRSAGRGRIGRSQARSLLAGGDRSAYEWAPWTRR